MLVFIDDYNIRMMSSRSLSNGKLSLRKQTTKKIKRLRIDNDMEFYGKKSNEFVRMEEL